jgi:hypothetical protein
MFIRWKRRKALKDQRPDSLYCVLLESERVNGVPRQKTVRYLGRIHEGDTAKEYGRLNFWDVVTPKLDALPISRVDRGKIIKSIDSVVPKLPRAQAAALRVEQDIGIRKSMEILDRLVARLPAKRHRRPRCRHLRRCRLCGRCRQCGRPHHS